MRTRRERERDQISRAGELKGECAHTCVCPIDARGDALHIKCQGRGEVVVIFFFFFFYTIIVVIVAGVFVYRCAAGREGGARHKQTHGYWTDSRKCSLPSSILSTRPQ